MKSMPRRVGCIILAPLGVGGSGRGREGGREGECAGQEFDEGFGCADGMGCGEPMFVR